MRYFIGPLTREQSEEQMTGFVRHRDRGGLELWAGEYKASGAFIGFIDRLYQNDWPEGAHKTEVGWGRLDRACWHRELATKVLWQGLRYGFEELGQERIISIIHRADWPRGGWGGESQAYPPRRDPVAEGGHGLARYRAPGPGGRER